MVGDFQKLSLCEFSVVLKCPVGGNHARDTLCPGFITSASQSLYEADKIGKYRTVYSERLCISLKMLWSLSIWQGPCK